MRLCVRVVAAAAALLLCACHPPPQDSNPVELRIYEVPKGTVRPLITTLKDVFWEEHKVAGRATITPDGRLMVLAPSNMQVGVQQLVDEITKHPPTLEQSIELRYWLVVGRPATAPQPPVTELTEIQPALTEIARTQGPQTFTVAQRVRISSLNDEWGKAETEQLKIGQKAVQTNDGVFAEIEIHYAKTDKVETRVRIGADQIVVLGATGQQAGDVPSGATLYYVVRVAPRTDGQHP